MADPHRGELLDTRKGVMAVPRTWLADWSDRPVRRAPITATVEGAHLP